MTAKTNAEFDAMTFNEVITDIEESLTDGTGLGIALTRKMARTLLDGIKARRECVLEAAGGKGCDLSTRNIIELPTEKEIAAYRDLFRAELDKRMDTKHPSASPSTEAHSIALHRFVAERNHVILRGSSIGKTEADMTQRLTERK